jgi:hypothetical protein
MVALWLCLTRQPSGLGLARLDIKEGSRGRCITEVQASLGMRLAAHSSELGGWIAFTVKESDRVDPEGEWLEDHNLIPDFAVFGTGERPGTNTRPEARLTPRPQPPVSSRTLGPDGVAGHLREMRTRGRRT